MTRTHDGANRAKHRKKSGTAAKKPVAQKKPAEIEVRLRDYVFDYGLPSVMAFSNIGYAIANWDNPTLWPLGFAVANVACSTAIAYRQPMVSRLKNELHVARAKYRDARDEIERYHREHGVLLREFLRLSHDQLHFGESERISVFYVNRERLIPFSRYSANHALCRFGRKFYPKDFGPFAIACRRGKIHVNGLPDPETDFLKYLAEVEKHQPPRVKCALSHAEWRKRTLIPRSYAAIAIHETHANDPIGIIEFASQQPHTVQLPPIEKFLNGGGQDFLARCLKNISPTSKAVCAT